MTFSDASAKGNMQVASHEAIQLQGRTVAGESMQLASESLTVESEQVSAKFVDVASAEVRVNEGSALYATDSLSLTGGNLNNLGEVAGKNVSIELEGKLENHGDLLADHAISVSAEDVVKVVDHINEEGITVLFVEEYTDQSSVQSIVDETGVDIQILYTMEMAPTDSSDDYLSLMNKNFDSLEAGMSCSA